MKIKIALAQVAAGTDRQANIEKGTDLLTDTARQGADIICFPEMSFCQFFPQYHARKEYFDWAEPVPGPTVEQFQKACAKNSVAAIINVYEQGPPGQHFDSSAVVDKSGTYIGKSHMMHITELPDYNEKYYYWEGRTDYPVFETGGLKFGIAICYDRHFPEHMRILALKGAEIIFVPTATSLTELKNIWEVEMQAASVANQVFIAVANHAGIDGNIHFFGKSFVVNPFGELIAMAGEGEELLSADIDLDEIEQARRLLPFLRDRRPETYDTLIDLA